MPIDSPEHELMLLVEWRTLDPSYELNTGQLARDLGYIRAGTDSSAAKRVAKRRRVGKIRHLRMPLLWLQAKSHSGEIKISKIGIGHQGP